MKRRIATVMLCTVAVLAVGCADRTVGTVKNLGPVDYDKAFAAAEKALSQHYTLARADADSGVIEARPRTVQGDPDKLIGASPARQLARMRIDREDGDVLARLSIAVQRQRTPVYRMIESSKDNYDTVPHETPAEQEAATTVEQNQAWQTQHYDRALEAQILEELYAVLRIGDEG